MGPTHLTALITPWTTPNHPCWPQTWAPAAATPPRGSREEIHSLGPKWTLYLHGISSFWASPFFALQAQEFCFRDNSEATGPDWNLGQFWTGKWTSLTCCQDSTETAELKTCHGQCAVQAYSENTCQKTSGYVLSKETTWTYLIEPLSWFLFTPHSSWGCRKMAQQQTQQRMDKWTQSMPGHPWSPHCHFFLVFYPLWCREESSPFSKRETEAQRPQFSVCRSLTGHSQLPLKAAGELQPLLKISAWITLKSVSCTVST